MPGAECGGGEAQTAGSRQLAANEREAGRRQQAAGSGQAESRAQRGKRRTPCAMRFARVAVRTAGRRQRAAGSKTGTSDAALNRLNNSMDSITQITHTRKVDSS